MSKVTFGDPRLPARFWSKVRVTTDGCWMWTAGTNGRGYGCYYHGKTTKRAHGVAYETLVGPVPEGKQLDHLCRQRLCANPSHLEPVTNRENTLRGIGTSAQNARKTHCPRGHPYTGHDKRGRRCVVCDKAWHKAKYWANPDAERERCRKSRSRNAPKRAARALLANSRPVADEEVNRG